MKEAITVLIPNYNGEKLLKNNLPSIISSLNAYSKESKIIIVDDGSMDNSLKTLKSCFPEIETVVHDENKGFAEAVHSGIAAAKTELIFLLNSDVIIPENIFDQLVCYFNDEDTFAVSPLICNEEGTIKRHSWNLRQFRGGLLKLMKWNLDDALALRKKGERLPSLYASGGSQLIRKSMFEALEGFDPTYKPFYGEDADLGLRAWRNGWGSYFEPNARIVHQSQGAIKQNNQLNYVKCIRRRNRYILEWTHLDMHQLLLFSLPVTLFRLIGEMLLFEKTNLKGFCLAIPRVPKILIRRSRLKTSSALSLGHVLATLRGYCQSET